MRNIAVTSCWNCPFFQTEFDDFAIGDPHTYKCGLQFHLKYENYFVGVGRRNKIKSTNHKTKDDCPLLPEPVNVSFNEN